MFIYQIVNLFTTFIIAQAEIDKNAQTKDQIIQVFAFLTFSSSHQETKYITQLIIIDKTDITATYFINSAIKDHIYHQTISSHVFSQKGNHQQLTSGAAKQVLTFKVIYAKNI